MAIVVEDGTGKSNAETYISVSDADSYHSDRGESDWTGTDAAKEQALRKAADYMFRYQWKGERVDSDQALDWPRIDVQANGFDVLSDTVPDRVKHAQAELALRALTSDLVADLTRTTTRESVGPISVDYAPGSREQTHYAIARDLLRPYIHSGTKLLRV